MSANPRLTGATARATGSAGRPYGPWTRRVATGTVCTDLRFLSPPGAGGDGVSARRDATGLGPIGETGDVAAVQRKLLDWYGTHRRDLPWRETRDPYRI